MRLNEDTESMIEATGRRAEHRRLLPALLMRLPKAREAGVVIVTLLVAAYFAVTVRADPAHGVLPFLSIGNLTQMLPYFAPLAILAAGEVFLMINGEIDLSGAVHPDRIRVPRVGHLPARTWSRCA
jgi:ABC-type xylose transport system permease subunit